MIEYPNIDPVIFGIGPFQLRWYSLMYVIGLVAVYTYCRYSVKKGTLRMSLEQVESMMVYGLVGMIVGARLVYVGVYNLPFYLENPADIPAVWKGGLSFHGAFIGIMTALILFVKRHNLEFLNVTDHVCQMMPIGLGFGRIGNFINGELWGRVTDSQWGMIFPGAGPLPRHPSQLYESVLEGWVLLVVLWIVRMFKPRDGVVSCCLVMGYAAMRFVVEFFREPDAQLGTIIGPYSMGQILCALMFLFGFTVFVFLMQRRPAGAAST